MNVIIMMMTMMMLLRFNAPLTPSSLAWIQAINPWNEFHVEVAESIWNFDELFTLHTLHTHRALLKGYTDFPTWLACISIVRQSFLCFCIIKSFKFVSDPKKLLIFHVAYIVFPFDYTTQQGSH